MLLSNADREGLASEELPDDDSPLPSHASGAPIPRLGHCLLRLSMGRLHLK